MALYGPVYRTGAEVSSHKVKRMMRVASAGAVCCALLSAGLAIGDDPSQADSEKLQGKWGWLPQKVHINYPPPSS